MEVGGIRMDIVVLLVGEHDLSQRLRSFRKYARHVVENTLARPGCIMGLDQDNGRTRGSRLEMLTPDLLDNIPGDHSPINLRIEKDNGIIPGCLCELQSSCILHLHLQQQPGLKLSLWQGGPSEHNSHSLLSKERGTSHLMGSSAIAAVWPGPPSTS
jgi:hypothetical protein